VNQNRVRWLLRVGAFGCVGALVVAGCGSSGKSSAPVSPAGTVSSAPTTSSVGTTAPSSATSLAGTAAGSSAVGSRTAVFGGTSTISGPGVTATEIKIGQIATVSGPVPGLFQNSADSMDAFVAYVNSEGGIDGHKLVMVHKDDAYDCVTYTNALKTLATQVFAVVGTFSVVDSCGASVLKADPMLPDIHAENINPSVLAQPNAFAAETQPPGYFTTSFVYLKQKYPDDITKTADLYPSSASFDYKAERITAESVGFRYLYARGIGTAESNFTSDILRMKSAGVKIVDLTDDTYPTDAAFVQEAAQQGFHPDAIIAPTAYDSQFFTALGSNVDAANVIVAPQFQALYLGQDTATNPEMATYLTWLAKTHPGQRASIFGTTAWAAGVLFAQAMQHAGPAITQASLLQGVAALGDFDADGLLSVQNPAARTPPQCEIMVGIHNGTFVRLDPASTGFDCDGHFTTIPASELG
jgi:ABC-type branched-subunit amino acid transport system substrate-binding protein